MSYADVRLDLSTVSVACLSGANGAGKSALLDAVTWALWEQARSTSDELVRLGEKEMWVDLVFEYEGRVYRVRRSRQKRASRGGQKISKGTLDLQVLTAVSDHSAKSANEPSEISSFISKAYSNVSHRNDVEVAASQSSGAGWSASGSAGGSTLQSVASATGLATIPDQVASESIATHPAVESDDEENALGHWRSLTGANMRATQQSLCDLLRMDYDTFINSAYLRQGKADEFTMRAPAERKQVLSEILGLSYFDRLQEACKLKARDSKSKLEMLEGTLLNLPEVERQFEEAQNQLVAERANLETKTESYNRLAANVQKLTERVNELKLMQQRIESSTTQLQELRLDVEQLERRKVELVKRRDELMMLIDKSEEIKDKADRFGIVKAELEELDQKSLSAQTLIEKRMELQSQLANIRSRLEVELEHIRLDRANLEKKVRTLQSDTADGAKVKLAHDEFRKLLQEEALLAQKQDAYTGLSERVTHLQTCVSEAQIKLEAEIGQKELSLAEFDEALSAEPLLVHQREELEKEAKDLDRIEAEFDLVEEQGMLLKSEIEAIDGKQEEIKRRKQENEEKIRELQEHKHTSLCPLCAAPIVDRLAVLNRYQESNDELDSEYVRLIQGKSSLEIERAEMRVKYMQLKRDLDRRKELDKRIGQFNEKEEAIKRARDQRSKLAADLANLTIRLENKDFALIERESLINVKSEIHKLDFDPLLYSSLQSQIRAKRNIESRYHQLKKDQAELEKLDQELPRMADKEAKVHSELASEAYGEDLRVQLKELKEELASMNYDRERHQALKVELQQLLPFSEQVRDLKRAQQELPEVAGSLADVETSFTSKSERIPEVESDINRFVEETGELATIEPELAHERERVEWLRQETNVLSRDLAVTESRKDQLESELNKLSEQRKQVDQLSEEKEDYLFLAESFGKKGIQAVIIENAVPEIETEANRILSRLSDNKMHVALVTQQKNKSGTVSETLDILIGDEIGTRNYELYSGGEAFKVNFAIRIALSRLLARRAGARLETLIIDEGFGSQDDVSRDRLVRAIKSIQCDFQKILVITHIADVREMFPVQIQVTKQSGVSRLQVV